MPGQESPAPNCLGLGKFSITAPHRLFSPFTRTSFLYFTLTRVPGRSLSNWRWEELVLVSPALLSGRLRPSMATFLLGPPPWSPHLSFPSAEHPGIPGPGLLLYPWGMCPLHIFSAITPGALEPSHPLPPNLLLRFQSGLRLPS